MCIPHVASLCVYENANDECVRPVLQTACRVTVMVLREIRKIQTSTSVPTFMSFFSYASHKAHVLWDKQEQELREILRRHLERNVGQLAFARDNYVPKTRQRTLIEEKHQKPAESKRQLKLKLGNAGPSNAGAGISMFS